MNPETIAQIVLSGLRIYETILNDIPKERREQLWRDWFEFCDRLRALNK